MKKPQQTADQVDEALPERLFNGVTLQQGGVDPGLKIKIQLVNQHIFVLKIAVDGASRHPGPLGDQRAGGVVEAMLGHQLQCGLQDRFPFIFF